MSRSSHVPGTRTGPERPLTASALGDLRRCDRRAEVRVDVGYAGTDRPGAVETDDVDDSALVWEFRAEVSEEGVGRLRRGQRGERDPVRRLVHETTIAGRP